MLGLGAFDTGNRFYSTENDVSASGAVVVGTTRVAAGVQAFRWEAGVMTGLGVLPDYQESVAQVVSGNGSLIFGRCQRIIESEESFVAFVWDPEHGMRQLDEVLATDSPLGVAGWTLEDVFGVSADGRTLVGSGKNPSGTMEGWIAQLGRP